jgi:SAM-dependent methyltransferase
LNQLGYECTGLGISNTAIESARDKTNNLNGIQFRRQDITHKPLETINEYNVIIENWFLHCIIGEDREKLLKHIHELLLPGGVFVGATMCGEVQGEVIDKHFNQETRLLMKRGIAIRHIGTEESLLAEFSAAGFVTLTHGIKHLGKENSGAEEFYFLLQKEITG